MQFNLLFQQFFNLETLIFILNIAATATMALTGVIQAVRHQLDPLGAGVLALITAVGGGTVRDLLLGNTPVFWLTDLTYIATVMPVALIGIIWVSRLKAGEGYRSRLLESIDAFGLGLFTIVGIQKSLALGLHPSVAILVGCINGVAGGMIRDLLCNTQPAVLKKDLYASLALIGGTLYILLIHHISVELAMLITLMFIAISRILVVFRPTSLPTLGKFND